MYRKHNKIDNWVRKTVGHVQQLGFNFFCSFILFTMKMWYYQNPIGTKSTLRIIVILDLFFSSFFVVNIINVIKFYSLWGTEESRKSSFKNESSMRLKKWKLQTANNHKNRMEVKHKLN